MTILPMSEFCALWSILISALTAQSMVTMPTLPLAVECCHWASATLGFSNPSAFRFPSSVVAVPAIMCLGHVVYPLYTSVLTLYIGVNNKAVVRLRWKVVEEGLKAHPCLLELFVLVGREEMEKKRRVWIKKGKMLDAENPGREQIHLLMQRMFPEYLLWATYLDGFSE